MTRPVRRLHLWAAVAMLLASLLALGLGWTTRPHEDATSQTEAN
jgi:hypothetical protein